MGDKRYNKSEKGRKARAKAHKRYYRKTAFAANGGEPYSAHECDLILAHGITDHELSQLIGRSVGAIQKKRWKLKGKCDGRNR